MENTEDRERGKKKTTNRRKKKKKKKWKRAHLKREFEDERESDGKGRTEHTRTKALPRQERTGGSQRRSTQRSDQSCNKINKGQKDKHEGETRKGHKKRKNWKKKRKDKRRCSMQRKKTKGRRRRDHRCSETNRCGAKLPCEEEEPTEADPSSLRPH